MRKILLILLILIVGFNYHQDISADVVFGNEFENSHNDKLIKPQSNRFVVEAPEGYVIIKDKPGSNRDMVKYLKEELYGDSSATSDAEKTKHIESIIRFENGQEFVVDGAYDHGGKYWGVMPTSHYVSYPGWVPMEYLRVVYTREDFEIEHQSEIQQYDNIFKTKSHDKLVVWEWPGSDREKHIIDSQNMPEIGGTKVELEYFRVRNSYKDPDGREWGYGEIVYNVPEYYYDANLPWTGWICLNEPDSIDIPAFNPAPEPMMWAPDNQGFTTAEVHVTPGITGTTPPSSNNSIWGMVLMVVALVVFVFAVRYIYKKFFKKSY